MIFYLGGNIDLVIWLIIISIFSYCIFLVWLYVGWKRLAIIQMASSCRDFVSVIIPVRNEAGNIERLLADLENQNYPTDKYEVLIINDHSTDSTRNSVLQWKDQSVMQMELFDLIDPETSMVSSKKAAITLGVDRAKGNIILLTDGDSRMDKNLLQTYGRCFSGLDFKLIAGPVFIKADQSLFSRIQAVEFASLMGTGAALFSWGFPAICNGANLAFTREVFRELDGYKGVEHIISGDDVYLLKKVKKKYPGRVGFIKSPEVIVFTSPVATLKEFINQRKRWAGKWKNHSDKIITWLGIFIFYIHCCVLTGLILTLMGRMPVLIFTLPILIRILLEYFFINDIFNFGKRRMDIIPFILCAIFYSFYAVFFGIMANVGNYTWKGRQYKN
jgi:cellulose synthase/poly-beta-1,6-N-acetylglucosamine synthase-like glycosyltransferase